jgi:hypothetical protein
MAARAVSWVSTKAVSTAWSHLRSSPGTVHMHHRAAAVAERTAGELVQGVRNPAATAEGPGRACCGCCHCFSFGRVQHACIHHCASCVGGGERFRVAVEAAAVPMRSLLAANGAIPLDDAGDGGTGARGRSGDDGGTRTRRGDIAAVLVASAAAACSEDSLWIIAASCACFCSCCVKDFSSVSCSRMMVSRRAREARRWVSCVHGAINGCQQRARAAAKPRDQRRSSAREGVPSPPRALGRWLPPPLRGPTTDGQLD